MLLKQVVGGCALNSHGNLIVDHGKPWKNHGIVFLNFCENPVTLHLLYLITWYLKGCRGVVDKPLAL